MASISIPQPNTLALQGEVDLNDSPAIKAQLATLLASKPPRVFIDLSEVSYIDSSGLAVLIEAMQRIHAYSGALALYGIHTNVENVFHISRLDQVFRIFPDRAAAEKGLSPIA